MAPCILMVDEIEKALAGSSGDGGDGGVGTRVFGSLLSWMNDKTSPVFVVATANKFERLPPEMLRKGRFDEIFFVDFPHSVEREQIFKIHIRKALEQRKIPPSNSEQIDEFIAGFGLDRVLEKKRTRNDGIEVIKGTVIQMSFEFTGSEIEETIKSARIAAYCDGKREMTVEDVAQELVQTVPLIDRMRDDIKAIRERAANCAVSASRASVREEQPIVVCRVAEGPSGADGETPIPIRGGQVFGRGPRFDIPGT